MTGSLAMTPDRTDWAHFTITMPLSTKMCKCLLGERLTLRWTSSPSRGGGGDAPSFPMLREFGMSTIVIWITKLDSDFADTSESEAAI